MERVGSPHSQNSKSHANYTSLHGTHSSMAFAKHGNTGTSHTQASQSSVCSIPVWHTLVCRDPHSKDEGQEAST